MDVIATWLGESLREMAVLVAVFAPLDVLVQGKALTLRSTVFTMGMVFALFTIGVLVEVKRWKR